MITHKVNPVYRSDFFLALAPSYSAMNSEALTSLIKTFEGGFQSFCYRFHLRYRYHSYLPLVVVTYDNRYQSKNKDDQSVTDFCRGIVLETRTWRVVAKSFTRFFKAPELKQLRKLILGDKVIVEVKEDGSFLNLFCHQGQWLLATRNNFANDLVYDESMNYCELFEKSLGLSVTEIGSFLDPDIVYSFEVCSVHNRIIKKYDEPKVYLLGCFQGDFEIPIDQNIYHLLPKLQRVESFDISCSSLNDIEKILNERVSNDPLFEGFVLKFQGDDGIKRMKIKNKLYLLVHGLKYRGWSCLTTDTVNMIRKQYPQHVDTILDVLKQGRSVTDYTEYALRFSLNFTDKITKEHSESYCYLTKSDNVLEQSNDGMASVSPSYDFDTKTWSVQCFCGKAMKLINLKMDKPIYKTCPVCDVHFDYLVYQVGTLLWICTDELCNLTHQAHQKTFGNDVKRGQPTGIPCSRFCKDLRLSVHQLMNDKKVTHKNLAHLLKMEESKTHISLFGIHDCIKVLNILNKVG